MLNAYLFSGEEYVGKKLLRHFRAPSYVLFTRDFTFWALGEKIFKIDPFQVYL